MRDQVQNKFPSLCCDFLPRNLGHAWLRQWGGFFYPPRMYAKIFNQIYDSSIAEDPHVRFTFMDLIVLADSDGVVDMTHEAIARRTNVPIEWVRSSITALESPDLKSRTPDHNGARIVRIDDHRDWGWIIVNFDRFRQVATDEQRREKTKLRVRRHRSTRVTNSDSKAVTLCNANVTPPYASASVSESEVRGVGEGDLDGVKEFERFWMAYPKKRNRADAEHAFSESGAILQMDRVLRAIQDQKQLPEWTKERGTFIPNPSSWLRDRRWEDQVEIPNSDSYIAKELRKI